VARAIFFNAGIKVITCILHILLFSRHHLII
jgi:hypothetical protein